MRNADYWKQLNTERGLWQLICVLLFFMFISFIVSFFSMDFSLDNRLLELNIQGSYRVDDTEWLPLTEPADLVAEKGTKVEIKGCLGSNAQEGDNIWLFIRNATVTMSVNNELIFNSDFRSNLTHTEFSSAWLPVTSPGLNADTEVYLAIWGSNAPASARLLLENIELGDHQALLRKQIADNFPVLLMAFAVLIIGSSLIVAIIVFRMLQVEFSNGYFACGMLLICGSISSLINYDYITLLCYNIPLVNLVDFLTHALLCIMLVFYSLTFVKTKAFRNFCGITIAILLAGALWCGANAIRYNTLIDKYVYIQIVLATVLLFIVLGLAAWDNHKIKDFQTLMIFMSAHILWLCMAINMMSQCFGGKGLPWLFLSGLLLFAVVHSWLCIKALYGKIESAKRAEAAERQLTESKVTIMLSQIHPHFLYNALTIIKDLCQTDPKKAETAIDDFAFYLRGNMDSLQTGHTIPFMKELEHTNHYLEIEKLRFGDRLQVEYNLETIYFRLPTLVLQPIVENAVQHGITKKRGGGTVSISTHETENSFQVIVKDDGAGYDTSCPSDQSKTHIGLENVRRRLQLQCNGTLEINSQVGGGTVVVITIPKGEMQYGNKDTIG